MEYLQTAPPEVQEEFATVALSRLAHIYLAEAELARDEYSREQEDQNLLAWSRAVERYARQLPQLEADIELGFPVVLRRGRGNTLTVAVGDRAIMVNHPRSDQQAAFEQSVLALFCARQSCEKFTATDSGVESIPVTTARVKPDWTFSDSGPVCAYRGLRVQFSSTIELARARSICTQFMYEALSLADEMAWQRRHEVAIQWETLSIHATPRRPEHRVELNALGDSILMVAPLVCGSAGLLQDMRFWLKARTEGNRDASLFLRADKYSWGS